MTRLFALTTGALADHLVDRLSRWPVESQQVARRNAMLACTTLAARRVEREDVDDYLRGAALAAHG